MRLKVKEKKNHATSSSEDGILASELPEIVINRDYIFIYFLLLWQIIFNFI